jgi:hypothetical protein
MASASNFAAPTNIVPRRPLIPPAAALDIRHRRREEARTGPVEGLLTATRQRVLSRLAGPFSRLVSGVGVGSSSLTEHGRGRITAVPVPVPVPVPRSTAECGRLPACSSSRNTSVMLRCLGSWALPMDWWACSISKQVAETRRSPVLRRRGRILAFGRGRSQPGLRAKLLFRGWMATCLRWPRGLDPLSADTVAGTRSSERRGARYLRKPCARPIRGQWPFGMMLDHP